MQMYNWQEIKETGDCMAYMRQLGIQPHGTESKGWQTFKCPPWRPESDSLGFRVCRTGFKDHAKNETGSIIDLCARAEFDGDIWKAQEKLGQMLGLKPTNEKPRKKRKIVEVYDYTDLDGNLRHQTVRFDPKDFMQRRPDPKKEGGFIWNLAGIETVLYRLKDWHDKPSVCVVGGEKDVDNLLAMDVPATTNPMGEGNWQPHYNEWFKGKTVYILPDNDEAGRKHAEEVATNLLGTAAKVLILRLPNLPPKGDATDWIAIDPKTNNKKALGVLCKTIAKEFKGKEAAKALSEPKAEPEPEPEPADERSVAKQSNRHPFKNYRIAEVEGPTGPKETKEPLTINELVKEIHKRFCGAPFILGSALFDHDFDSQRIRYITSTAELFAWIGEKSKQSIFWGKMEGAVSQEQLFHALQSNGRRYNMISGTPSHPPRDDVYYTYQSLPRPHPKAAYFNEFVDFFCPSTKEDKLMLRAFFASPLFYKPRNNRPMWVIDSSQGQQVGKTTIPDMAAYLYGAPEDPESQATILVNQAAITNEFNSDRVERRMLSAAGRKKKILLVDNVTGYFHCSQLANWLTASHISGLPPYGKGEETRPNDLTYVLTSNSASLDRDLIVRSIFIEVKRPKGTKDSWTNKVQEFVRKYRLQIIADIMGLLMKNKEREPWDCNSSFKDWEREIMQPMIGNYDDYCEVWKAIAERRHSSDGEMEEAESIRDKIRENLSDMGIDPETEPVWLHSDLLIKWCHEAIPNFGGWSGRGIPHRLRNMAKGGMITEIATEPRVFPASGKYRKRGMPWNFELRKGGVKAVRVVGLDTDKRAKEFVETEEVDF